MLEELNPERPPLLGDDEDDPRAGARSQPRQVAGPDNLKPTGVWEGVEWVYDVRRGGQTWRFLIRVWKKKPEADLRNAEPAYVLRGYAPKSRFAAVEEDLKAALNSVELPK